MWKNLERESDSDALNTSKVSFKTVRKREYLFSQTLAETFPSLSSDLLELVDEFTNTCARAKFSPVVLGEANADWLAVSLVSGVTSAPIAQNFLLEMLKEGALMNNLAATQRTKDNVQQPFLPCHLVTFGNVTDAEKLFEECIKLASVLDTKVVTAEGVSELDRRLNRNIKVHVAKFPPGIPCASFRKTHNLNLNKPKKDGKHYTYDFARVLSVHNKGRLRVDISINIAHMLECHFCLPVNIVENGYVSSYDSVVASLRCDVNYQGSFSVRNLPSFGNMLPMLPWLEFCKQLTLRRRGPSAMAIVSVFVFFHLWDSFDAKRLREIMRMLKSREPSEVTKCLHYALQPSGMNDKDLAMVLQKALRCFTQLTKSIAACYCFHNDDNFHINYISPVTLR